jgi:L-asparaginase II
VSIATSIAIELPEHAFAHDVPMVAVMRGQYVGSLHRGSFAIADPSGHVSLSVGDPDQSVFLRSAAKPFQAMPAILGGAIERFELTGEETGVLCASHSAEPRHTEAVLSALHKAGLDESYLRCGIHEPIHQATAIRRWRDGLDPTPVCNNCSGAHTGMLLACVAHGWSTEGYGLPDHPLQKMTLEILAAFADVLPESIERAVDNCAVPAFRVPLRRAGQAFARLATGNGVSPDLAAAAGTVVGAMTTHPEMVAGEHRFDTELMSAGGGEIVAKGGAEGFQGAGFRSLGLGLALKISDGGSAAVAPAVMPLLDHLGVPTPTQIESLAAWRSPQVFDLREELVGSLRPIFRIGDRV